MVFGFEGLPGDRRRGTLRDLGRLLLDGLGYSMSAVQQHLECRDQARIVDAYVSDAQAELDQLLVPMSHSDLVHLVYGNQRPEQR